MATTNQSPYQSLEHDGDARDRIRLLSLAPGNYEDPVALIFSTRILPPARDDLTEVVRIVAQDFYYIEVAFAELAKSLLHPDVLRNLNSFRNDIQSMHKKRMLRGPPSSDTVEAIQLAKLWLEIRKGEGLGLLNKLLGTETIVALEEYLSSTVANETPYEALSYAWGIEMCPDEVLLDGCALQITHNLDIALRHLRHTVDTKTMWIDALCINQADVVERSSQVQLMNRIYATAERTIVWLGPAANESDMILKKLEEGKIDMHHLLPLLYGTYLLMTRSWWSRVWVLQEVALSKSVVIQCGTHSLPFDTFAQRINCLPDPEKVGIRNMIHSVEQAAHFFDTVHPSKLSRGFVHFVPHIRKAPYEHVVYEVDKQLGQWRTISRAAIIVRQELRKSRAPTALPILLEMTRTFDATDPRDKIYALLGLCAFNGMSAFQTHKIVPDYLKPIGFVYSEAMAITLMQDFSISFPLWTLHSARDQIDNLPSWVPNMAHIRIWERDAQSASVASNYCPGQKLVQDAVRKLTNSKNDTLYPRFVSFSHDFSQLHTIGHLLGTIKNSVVLRAGSEDVHAEFLEDVAALQACFSAEGVDPLTAASALLGRPGEPMDQSIEHMTNFGDPFEKVALEDLPKALHDQQFLWDVVHKVLGQTVFITDTGRVGRSVGDFEKGDVVAGLFGIDLAFVLKRAGNGEYTMVNPAHVADHVLSPPWRDRDQRFRKRRRIRTRLEEKFTII